MAPTLWDRQRVVQALEVCGIREITAETDRPLVLLKLDRLTGLVAFAPPLVRAQLAIEAAYCLQEAGQVVPDWWENWFTFDPIYEEAHGSITENEGRTTREDVGRSVVIARPRCRAEQGGEEAPVEEGDQGGGRGGV
jgi:hypothetical protein